MTAEELVFYAALASKRDGGQDAIDFCICQAIKAADKCVTCVIVSLCIVFCGCPYDY